MNGFYRTLPGNGAISTSSQPHPKQRLDSWKEIAAFFERDERTVRRWEMERGLPIHRVPGEGRGGVYAFTTELEEWLRGSQSQPAAAGVNAIPPGSHPFAVSNSAARQVIPDEDSPGQNAAEKPRTSISQAPEDARLRTAILPWVIAGLLAITVFAGVYSYRQTARFAARAAGNRESGTLPHVPTPEVQDLYLKGRYYWSKRTPEDLNKAVDYFTQAIVKDPAYAPAFVGLADCYNLLREFSVMPPREAYPRALAAAQKAIELDDSSAEAHNSFAFATFYWNWDPATAEREFKRALQLNPNFVQGHHWYATFLLANRRFPEALDQIEQARALDPSSTTILADKGFILSLAGQKKDGFALLTQLEATDPSLATTRDYLAKMFFEQKDYAHSFEESKRAAQLRNDPGALAVAEAKARGFASGGIRGMHEAVLPVQEKLFSEGTASAYDLAATCAALGKKEDALRFLQIAFDRRDLEVMFLREHTEFNDLRDDPAYQEILAKVEQHRPKTTSQ